MTIQEIEERRAAIAQELETDGADLDALETEVRQLAEAEKEIRDQAQADAEKRAAIAEGVSDAKIIETKEIVEEKKMTDVNEVRNSKAYLDAFANFIKTGNDEECRALLTTNVTGGTIAVPVIVENAIKTAWEKQDILSRVTKTYFKGNVKIGYESSATGAVIHTEGGAAIDPQTLVIGYVELIPQSFKKLVQISDEVYDLTGEEFISYIYDELGHYIAKKIADEVVTVIRSAGAGPAVGSVTGPIAKSTLINALATLSDEVTDPVLIVNKATWAAFANLTTQEGYPIPDPFAGLTVVFNNTLPTYADAGEGAEYAIVADLKGVHVNFPNGEDIEFKFDNRIDMASDLINILGRSYAAVGYTTPYSACLIYTEGGGE